MDSTLQYMQIYAPNMIPYNDGFILDDDCNTRICVVVTLVRTIRV